MKASELRQKTKPELNELLLNLAKEQFNLRMQKRTQQLTKPDQLKKVRKDIARVQMILNETVEA